MDSFFEKSNLPADCLAYYRSYTFSYLVRMLKTMSTYRLDEIELKSEVIIHHFRPMKFTS
jgi:hypothetical protein